MPLALLIPVGLFAAGYFIDKAGEGIESTSNGAVKLALTAGVLLIAAKKFKVI